MIGFVSNRFLLEMNVCKHFCWALFVLFREVRKFLQMNCFILVDFKFKFG